MILINKAEKEAIVKKYPHTHIVRTMKQDAHRHHYYCVEDRRVMKLLEDYRNSNVVEEHPPRAKLKRA